MDANLADFLTSRLNSNLSFKDMTFSNTIGLLQGTDTAGFLMQFWGLVADLLFLGLERADFVGDPLNPNEIFSFESEVEESHPLKMYCRHLENFTAVFRFEPEEAAELMQSFA